jgi:hypothetical protein
MPLVDTMKDSRIHSARSGMMRARQKYWDAGRSRWLVYLFCISALLIAVSSCKSPEKPQEPEQPHQVTVRAIFYNHTQGLIGEKTYTGMSGQSLAIKVGDIAANNVDSQRIAVRKAGGGSSLGRLVGFSRNGEVSTIYPNSDSDFEVYLMNTTAKAKYQLIDE